MRADKRHGFSLMEMMVVLLIVAIIAAASAPMVTKKLSRSGGTGDSPWVFTGLNNNIAYNMSGNDDSVVIIGNSSVPADCNARLFIDSGDNVSHIAFGNGDAEPLYLTADPQNGRIGFSDMPYLENLAVAFGINQYRNGYNKEAVAIGSGISNNSEERLQVMEKAVVIGTGAQAQGKGAVAIGYKAHSGKPIGSSGASSPASVTIGFEANGNTMDSVVIGPGASVNDTNSNSTTVIGSGAKGGANSVAMGIDSQSTANGSIAIGRKAIANAKSAIAIGSNVDNANDYYMTAATAEYSVAIGAGARATTPNTIVLGTASSTVYIPGKLVVGKGAVLGKNGGVSDSERVFLNLNDGSGNRICRLRSDDNVVKAEEVSDSTILRTFFSDRRLKNVGEKYVAGLDELKKLDFFHYTFKKDEAKTPHVGVMAQDLQKVFPDAVTKGEDGYLRIRYEDMFYAVINAVKELDSKISDLVEKVNTLVEDITTMKSTIEAQQKTIDELKAQNEEFQKRLEKLEKKNFSKDE